MAGRLMPPDWLFFPCLITWLPGVNSQVNHLYSNSRLIADLWESKPSLSQRATPLCCSGVRLKLFPPLQEPPRMSPFVRSCKMASSTAIPNFPIDFYLFWNSQGMWWNFHFPFPQETPESPNKCAGGGEGARARPNLQCPGPSAPAQEQKEDAECQSATPQTQQSLPGHRASYWWWSECSEQKCKEPPEPYKLVRVITLTHTVHIKYAWGASQTSQGSLCLKHLKPLLTEAPLFNN